MKCFFDLFIYSITNFFHPSFHASVMTNNYMLNIFSCQDVSVYVSNISIDVLVLVVVHILFYIFFIIPSTDLSISLTIQSFTYPSNDTHTHPSICWVIHSFIHSFIHSLTHSFIPSFLPSFLPSFYSSNHSNDS